MDLSVAADLVQSLTATLKDVRDDSDFISGIIFDAGTLCEKCKIDCNFQRRRVKRMPRRYDDSLVQEFVWHRVAVDSNEAFRLHVFLPIIDCLDLLVSLIVAFQTLSITVMLGVQALTPKHSTFLQKDKLVSFDYLQTCIVAM